MERKVHRLVDKDHQAHTCHDLRLRLAKAEETIRFNEEMRLLRDELHRLRAVPKCRRTIEDLGMVSIEYSHYYFSNDTNKMTWPNAQQFCRSYGLQLASIESNAENEQLDLYLLYSLVPLPVAHPDPMVRLDEFLLHASRRDTHHTVGRTGVGEHPAAYWLSATDAGHGGRFVWSGTGQPMIFNAWHTDMPKPPGFYGGRHRCVSTFLMDKKALSWGTFNCGEERRFICEMTQPCGA
ncbi:hypothetical protein B566_EDAN012563 [Ephemera danica]|nr:hypothetical protein B566_EDAN012563 [Ephemera danica]